MGRRIAMALAWGAAGYLAGAFGGGYAISVLSSNSHDGSVESAMTGAFVTGPLVALVAAIVGFARTGSRRA